MIRTAAQGRLLALVLLHPDEEFSLTELAEKARTSLPTVVREISRIVDSGLAKTRTVGRTRFVSAERSSPIYESMARVMEATFGASGLLSEELAPIDGINAAYVFGSWAGRILGLRGPPPNDVDVLVIGNPDREEVYQATSRVEERIGLPVQVTFRSLSQWDETSDPFLVTVKDGPLLEVPLG